MAQSQKQDNNFEQMRALCGQAGKEHSAQDAVNAPMIGHWCDAVGDRNPVYYDEQVARSNGWTGVVAPPAMLNTWTMPGKIDGQSYGDDPFVQCIQICDQAGYTGVVATNSDHEYLRYPQLGEQLRGIQTVTDISPLKTTALGIGYFITTNTDFYVGDELVGRMLFRIFKYRPNTGRAIPANGQMRMRPRPAISRDTAFFWEGLKQNELRIQQCTQCKTLHHPPMVRCANCGSYDMGHRTVKGDGTLYSFVEPYHPVVPFMRYPYVVGLIELREGVRLISNIVDCPPSKVRIGMKLKLSIEHVDKELSLPMFKPDPPVKYDTVFKRCERTRIFSEVEIGDVLPPWEIPITPTLIVAGAIASRDYQEVHHDRDIARERGAKDTFTNIMTTQGLCARYINDWTGPGARFLSMHTQLGVPNYPGDKLTMCAHVSDKSPTPKGGLLTLTLKGENQMGDHVNATIVVQL